MMPFKLISNSRGGRIERDHELGMGCCQSYHRVIFPEVVPDNLYKQYKEFSTLPIFSTTLWLLKLYNFMVSLPYLERLHASQNLTLFFKLNNHYRLHLR